MLVIFGLGNPNSEGTRHNAGLSTLEKIATLYHVKLRKRCFSNYKQALIKEKNVKLVFPLTFMNRSGEAVPYTVTEGDEVLVIVDQLDLPPGTIRLRRKGSSAGHNGLRSMLAALPGNFMRLYIGIGRPSEGVATADYVLSKFTAEQQALIERAETKAANIVKRYIEGEDLNRLMQEANTEQG